jgi:hypothetical protein
MSVFALVFAIGAAVQGSFDQEASQKAQRERDATLTKMMDVLADIQRDRDRRDISPEVRMQLLRGHYERYNRLRHQLATVTESPAPKPLVINPGITTASQPSRVIEELSGPSVPPPGPSRRNSDEPSVSLAAPDRSTAGASNIVALDEKDVDPVMIVPSVIDPPPPPPPPPPIILSPPPPSPM